MPPNNKMKTNIIITGFMGTGKTEVGREVARIMGRKFYDTDEVINLDTGLSIDDIFKNRGEAYFRKLERDLLRELNLKRNIVISTGGGTFVGNADIENADLSAIIFCLTAAPEIIMKRILNNRERPLLSRPSPTKIERLLIQRKIFYDAIRHQVDTSEHSIADVAREIVSLYMNEISNCGGIKHEY